MINFWRKITLLVGDKDGNGLDLSGFRVSFDVEKTALQDPNTAKIDIYNLSKTTVARIADGDLKRIVLQAGYESHNAVIFDGNIISTSQVRNGADTILSIDAGDGQNGYSYALVNETVGAGYSNNDIAKKSFNAMKERGVKNDDLKAVSNETKYPRGRVLFGAARNYSREVSKNSDTQWSVQDGHLVYCKKNSTRDDRKAFILRADTGMIGSPKKDKDGVTVSCCLNALLRIYDPIRIESEFLTGDFKILSLKHSGDTHGNEWSTEIKACSLDPSTKKTTKK